MHFLHDPRLKNEDLRRDIWRSFSNWCSLHSSFCNNCCHLVIADSPYGISPCFAGIEVEQKRSEVGGVTLSGSFRSGIMLAPALCGSLARGFVVINSREYTLPRDQPGTQPICALNDHVSQRGGIGSCGNLPCKISLFGKLTLSNLAKHVPYATHILETKELNDERSSGADQDPSQCEDKITKCSPFATSTENPTH